MQAADQISRAGLLAAGRRENELQLHTLPTSTLGTILDCESLHIALAVRVEADVCEPHMCQCGRRMNARSLHGLSCKFGSG